MILQSTICLPCRTKCNVHSEIQWEMCNICYINLFSVHLLHCEVNSPSSRAQQFNCSLHTASQSILLHSWVHCIVLELFGRLLKGLMPVWKTKWVEAQVTPNWLFIPFSIKHPPPPPCDIIIKAQMVEYAISFSLSRQKSAGIQIVWRYFPPS